MMETGRKYLKKYRREIGGNKVWSDASIFEIFGLNWSSGERYSYSHM